MAVPDFGGRGRVIYSLRGAVVTIVAIAGVGAYSAIDRGMNYQEAKASVVMIDRVCDITETTTESDGTTVARGLSDSCSLVEEWETVREKRSKVVSGTATVHVSYVAPQDGSQQTAELKFNGRDDEFYELRAGDEIDVLVFNNDPAKIRKA